MFCYHASFSRFLTNLKRRSHAHRVFSEQQNSKTGFAVTDDLVGRITRSKCFFSLIVRHVDGVLSIITNRMTLPPHSILLLADPLSSRPSNHPNRWVFRYY